MRFFIVLLLTFILASSATAFDLGNRINEEKTNSHVSLDPGTPGTRQGGDTIASATLIEAIPYTNNGSTCDYNDDYDAACPYTGSTSRDVVYSFIPDSDINISVDLIGSTYDTKTYIYDAAMNEVACNDDFYSDYVSFISFASLAGGMTYYIVIDGYGGDCGEYIIAINEYIPPPPCFITCDGVFENEPPLEDGYVDMHNGGCNSENNSFTHLGDWPCGSYGDLTFCGTAGWYIGDDGVSEYRDTDWFIVLMGGNGVLEWTLDAESKTVGYVLDFDDCDNITVPQSMVAGPCSPQSLTITGYPGSLVYLVVGSQNYAAPDGFVGNEYSYQCDFVGIYNSSGATATEVISLDHIKSLYR